MVVLPQMPCSLWRFSNSCASPHTSGHRRGVGAVAPPVRGSCGRAFPTGPAVPPVLGHGAQRPVRGCLDEFPHRSLQLARPRCATLAHDILSCRKSTSLTRHGRPAARRAERRSPNTAQLACSDAATASAAAKERSKSSVSELLRPVEGTAWRSAWPLHAAQPVSWDEASDGAVLSSGLGGISLCGWCSTRRSVRAGDVRRMLVCAASACMCLCSLVCVLLVRAFGVLSPSVPDDTPPSLCSRRMEHVGHSRIASEETSV